MNRPKLNVGQRWAAMNASTAHVTGYSESLGMWEVKYMMPNGYQFAHWVDADGASAYGMEFDLVRLLDNSSGRNVPATEEAVRCECGAHAIGTRIHSDWCPKQGE